MMKYTVEYQDKNVNVVWPLGSTKPMVFHNATNQTFSIDKIQTLADAQVQAIATLKAILLQLQQSNPRSTCAAMSESLPLPSSIAGHPRKIISQGWCDCGVLWAKLRYATKDCIGQPGYAHQGALNEKELREVEVEVEREAGRISAAMADLGAGIR